MDENKNNGNFEEESFARSEMRNEAPQQPAQPQDQQPADPYNQPYTNAQQPADPYNQPYTNAQQPTDPYNQPYTSNQQNTYSQPYANNQQNTQNNTQSADFDPYKQPGFDPYKQPYNNGYNNGYNPYGQNPAMVNGTYPTGLATASLVIGIISILSVLFMFAFTPLFILPIIGIILGAVYKSKHYPVAKGVSTAGIITSAASLVLAVVILIVAVVFIVNLMYSDDGSGMRTFMQMLKDYSPEVYEEYYEQFYSDFPEWFDGISCVIKNLFIK